MNSETPIAHKKPGLLGLVTKSHSIVEETMWDEIKTAKLQYLLHELAFPCIEFIIYLYIAHVLSFGQIILIFLATPITPPTSCERPPLLKDQISLDFMVVSQKRDYVYILYLITWTLSLI